jgi:drug/metabolite transporter (DMT)-like permease
MRMDERRKFNRYVAMVVLILVLGGIFVVASGAAGEDNWASVMSITILITMAVVAIVVARRWSKELKAGFPRFDERSIAVRMRAGYLAFFVSLYFLLGMGMLFAMIEDSEVSSVPTAEWLMVFVAVMGIIFLAINAYLGRKGVPE